MLAIFACAPLLCLAAAPDSISITKHDETFATKRLDPNHPPAEIGKLIPGELAYTLCTYKATWKLDYRPAEFRDSGIDVEITDVQITLDFAVTLYCPDKMNFLLKAHEGGHRQIGEAFYKDADTTAHAITADKLIGKTFHGDGSDRNTAINAALAVAGKTFSDAYLAATSGQAQGVHERYDELTEHGKKLVPPPMEAVKQVLEEYQKKSKPPERH